MNIKKFIVFWLLFSAAGAAVATWDTTTPAGTESKSLGDDRIRELKTDVQTALRQSGVFPGNDTANPRFLPALSTGTTGQRPVGNNVSTGTWRINTTSGAIESYNGLVWQAYDVVPNSSISATSDIDSTTFSAPLQGGSATGKLQLNLDTAAFGLLIGTSTQNPATSTYTVTGSSLTLASGTGGVLVSTYTFWNQLANGCGSAGTAIPAAFSKQITPKFSTSRFVIHYAGRAAVGAVGAFGLSVGRHGGTGAVSADNVFSAGNGTLASSSFTFAGTGYDRPAISTGGPVTFYPLVQNGGSGTPCLNAAEYSFTMEFEEFSN